MAATPDLGPLIRRLFEIALQAEPPAQTTHYWSLWAHAMMRARILQAGLYLEMIPAIRAAIYASLPFSLVDRGLPALSARVCWSLIASIDPAGMFEFLRSQPPSESLCYSIGCLEFATNLPFTLDAFLPSVLQAAGPAPVALLFALSHSPTGLSSSPQLFREFLSFAIAACGTAEVAPMAVYAIHYVATWTSRLFLANGMEGLRVLIANAANFLNALTDMPVATRIFKATASLAAMAGSAEEVGELLSALFAPITEFLARFRETRAPVHMAEVAFQIIKECEAATATSSICFFGRFADLLMELLPVCVEIEHSEYLLGALGQSFAFSPYGEVRDRIASVIALLVEAHWYYESTFDFLTAVRTRHVELDEFYPMVHDSLIAPALQKFAPPLAAILRALGTFAAMPFEELMPLVAAGIRDLSEATNVAAVHCLHRVIDDSPPADFYAANRAAIVQPLWDALADSMHKGRFELYADFLDDFVVSAAAAGALDEAFFVDVAKCVQRALAPDECDAAIIGQFVSYLAECRLSRREFRRAVANFLAMQRRVGPSDLEVFKSGAPDEEGELEGLRAEIERQIRDDSTDIDVEAINAALTQHL